MVSFRGDERTVVERLRDGLVDLIAERSLKPGDQLPTEHELCEAFRVSRPALREALKLLEQESLIRVERGKGRFVSAGSALRAERPITRFESVTRMVRSFGYEPVNRVLSVTEEPAGGDVAAALGCEPGEPLVRLERLRLNGDRPILYCVDRFPRRLLDGVNGEIDWSGSLIELLASWGYRPVMSSAHASAVELPADVKAREHLADFGPALLIEETCYTDAGRPVVHALDYHRGDAFSFRFLRK